MNDATIELKTSNHSMRRTLLTLLGAICAFGVLTASYATAELPNPPVPAAAVQAPAVLP